MLELSSGIVSGKTVSFGDETQFLSKHSTEMSETVHCKCDSLMLSYLLVLPRTARYRLIAHADVVRLTGRAVGIRQVVRLYFFYGPISNRFK